MALDISNLSAAMDYSSLLPKNKGVLNDSILTQWSQLRSNGKALKAALRAEDRGYLRDKDGPKYESMSDKYFPSSERSTTVKDVLKMMGREPMATTEDADKADDTTASTTTDGKDSTSGSNSAGTSGVDVTA